ncbi:hypothetical protein PN441_19525 [Spirulina major CS-329]|uniref:competence protein CoiA family protein n=1 Tax=Spirulina TaxID=1154 RepID=UPI00232B2584|nr:MULTISPECIES: competence protein CoiA family protein [Spirulina]MDB9494646.1 hypothetical protein [Spirulina subsalsa CS-330]MDB9505275.1 hypothetical protein [Spirulina major CS-329]
MIKYQFAYNHQKDIIDILSLSKEIKSDHEPFSCLGCGTQLVPVLGKKRAKHFRHKVTVGLNCSPETYLHSLAKLEFYKVYSECLNQGMSYEISFKSRKVCNFYESEFLDSCNLSEESYVYDLTKYFDHVYLEKKEGNFIPDILLKNRQKNESMFLEFVVTHDSSEKKVSSSNRIIEFHLQSEKDIEIIQSKIIKESNNIKFINFKKKNTRNWCQGNCLISKIIPGSRSHLDSKRYDIFCVYKSGKSRILHLRLTQIEQMLNENSFLFHEIIDPSEIIGSKKNLYRSMVIYAYKKGIGITNCYLCKHHRSSSIFSETKADFCEYIKGTANSNKAAECKFFQPDNDTFSRYEMPFRISNQ